MSSLVDAFERWLPVPTYRFVGGPFDGKPLEVKLQETGRGYVPPEVWHLFDPPEVSPPWDADRVEVTARVVSYRFVPARGKINQGHYEFVP